MRSLVLSTVAFFVASHFLRRQAERMDLPKGMARSALVFGFALAISYGVALAMDVVFP
jgi:hypothetical protein